MTSQSINKDIVLILGSKPNAMIPLSDYTYCANASASYYEEKLKNHRNITSIVSPTEVMLGTRKNSPEKDKWAEDRKNRIAASVSDRIVMYWTDGFPNSIDLLKKTPCFIPISSVTSYEMIALIKSISGINIPALTYDHICKKDRVVLNLLKFFKNYIRTIVFNPHSMSGLFRPSTGIVALIYAISKHGKNAQYIVSGISIEGRGSYPDGSKNSWSGKKSLESHHVYVDKKMLVELTKKYNIKSTEKSLALILNGCK